MTKWILSVTIFLSFNAAWAATCEFSGYDDSQKIMMFSLKGKDMNEIFNYLPVKDAKFIAPLNQTVRNGKDYSCARDAASTETTCRFAFKIDDKGKYTIVKAPQNIKPTTKSGEFCSVKQTDGGSNTFSLGFGSNRFPQFRGATMQLLTMAADGTALPISSDYYDEATNQQTTVKLSK